MPAVHASGSATCDGAAASPGTPSGDLRSTSPSHGTSAACSCDDGFDLAFSTRLADRPRHHPRRSSTCSTASRSRSSRSWSTCFAPPLPSLASLRSALGRALGRRARRRRTRQARASSSARAGCRTSCRSRSWTRPRATTTSSSSRPGPRAAAAGATTTPRRREIIRAAHAATCTRTSTATFLDSVRARRRCASSRRLDDGSSNGRGGNGAHEIRTWLVMAAACGDARAARSCYSADARVADRHGGRPRRSNP